MGLRGPTKRKGSPTGIRFEPDLKAELERSAERSGRSLSEEVSTRLKWSYGSIQFNDPLTHGFAAIIGDAFNTIAEQEGHVWHQTQRSWCQARAAVLETLTSFEPGGTAGVPDDHPALELLRAHGMSDEVLSQVRGELENTEVGKFAARLAIARCEAVADGEKTAFTEMFEPIASSVKQKLDELRNSGIAFQDLVQESLAGHELSEAKGMAAGMVKGDGK